MRFAFLVLALAFPAIAHGQVLTPLVPFGQDPAQAQRAAYYAPPMMPVYAVNQVHPTGAILPVVPQVPKTAYDELSAKLDRLEALLAKVNKPDPTLAARINVLEAASAEKDKQITSLSQANADGNQKLAALNARFEAMLAKYEPQTPAANPNPVPVAK